VKFSDLIDGGRIATGGMRDFATSLVSPVLRLGVTGLARAGKTVFITALVHALLNGTRLPVFEAMAGGRILRTYLEPQPDDVVLEIGAGSGFQAAALSDIAHKVITLERWRDIAADARGRFGMARLDRTYAHVADGFDGWPEDAPYDRIVINGAVEDFPPALLEQLKPGGVIVAPIGDASGQRLIRMCNNERVDLGPVKFAPLERGVEDGEEPSA